MKKPLFAAALLTAGITQVQAAPIRIDLDDAAPTKGTATMKFSGYCSGTITSDVTRIRARLADGHAADNQFSQVIADVAAWDNMTSGKVSRMDSVLTSSSTSISKGTLSGKLNDKSFVDLSIDTTKIHSSGADSAVQCKNGQTLHDFLSDNGANYTMVFMSDSSMKISTSFTTKGKTSPFPYTYSQTLSGYLKLKREMPTCTITGDYTGNIATDSYKSTCKAVNAIKFTLSLKASGSAIQQNW